MAFNVRKHFLEHESSEVVIEAIELEATIETWVVRRTCRVHGARGDADGNRDWHVMFMDEIVENYRHSESESIQANIDTRGLVSGVLGRDVHCDLAICARKDLRVLKREFEDLALGHVGLGLGVGAGYVLFVLPHVIYDLGKGRGGLLAQIFLVLGNIRRRCLPRVLLKLCKLGR